MKNGNRWLGLAAAAGLAFGAAFPAGAEETVTSGGATWTYTVGTGGKATVTKIEPDAGTKTLTVRPTLGGWTLETIGERAAQYRTGLTKVTFAGASVIGDEAFYGCTGLTNVAMGSSIKTVGESAFEGCSSLRALKIGTNVTSIGYAAFKHCDTLPTVTIPDSVQSLGERAFFGCKGLTNAVIGAGLTKIDERTFENCTSLRSVTLGSGVTDIEYAAFSGCGMETLALPATVRYVGECAFDSCSLLASVTIGGGVQVIDEMAFVECPRLKTLVLGPNVKSIGMGAFGRCALSSVTIPAGVTNIGMAAFAGCEGPITVEAGNPSYAGVDGILYNKAKDTLVCYPLGKPAAWTAPSGVKRIFDGAFAFCSNLASAEIPSWTKEIGFGAFGYCSNLSWVSISEGVSAIGDYAFFSCPKLASVAIPAGVENIGEGTFMGCTGLASAEIPAGVTNIGPSAFESCPALKTLWIPSSVKSVGDYAFSGCASLATLHVPKAWEGTSMLDAADVPEGCTIVYHDSMPQTVWRFYSDATKGHFYTISESEKDKLIATSSTWQFEGGVYRAFPGKEEGTVPLYRFWSDSAQGHFFTTSESEKEKLVATSQTWQYEGVAYYVHPKEAEGRVPVYRFWSDAVQHHFYTASESEREKLSGGQSGWTYEGIAFWALPVGSGPKPQSLKPQTVWRFYSDDTQGHFFTISESEKSRLVRTSKTWQFEGGAYRAYTNAAEGTVPLYRFWSDQMRGHFFTISETEKARLVRTGKTWQYEGIAYYVYPKEAEGTVPVYRFWSDAVQHHFYTVSATERDRLRRGKTWSYEGIAFWALPQAKAQTAAKAEPPEKTAQAKTVAEPGETGHSIGMGTASHRGVAVTTSDGSDGSAVADGDGETGWAPEGEGLAWVILSLPEPVKVASVEVSGENLPEGMRVLLSEDAEEWFEGEGGLARYVWVAWEGEGVVVKEIRVKSGE